MTDIETDPQTHTDTQCSPDCTPNTRDRIPRGHHVMFQLVKTYKSLTVKSMLRLKIQV